MEVVKIKETLLAFIFSVGAVTLAEMGDKTQLLAMAFATRYKATKVLLGVFIATILNHALAVAVGTYLTKIENMQTIIQLIASLSFILFGLWTIRGDSLDGEDNVKSKMSAVLTVAISFFIAELGDKTQLTTIALSTKFPNSPIWVLMGTTSGMIISDSIGIIFGVVMCKRIPYKSIKLISAMIFVIFGLIGTGQVLIYDFKWNIILSCLSLLILFIITIIAARYLSKTKQKDEIIVCNNKRKYNS
ncbi:TMEM165/GDT1 family protein [Caldicellulosiruptoraceae bacterium PP1]